MSAYSFLVVASLIALPTFFAVRLMVFTMVRTSFAQVM